MINPVHLFTAFGGRIGRRAYWFGLIALIAISPFSISTILSQNPFTDAVAAIRNMGWAGVAWTLALFVPLAALNTKRLHDLGRSGIHAVLFYAPAAMATLELFLGRTAFLAQFQDWTHWIVGLAGVTGLWFLATLGFRGGTAGANRYGPEPGSKIREA